VEIATSVCWRMRGILTLNAFFSQFKRLAFFFSLSVDYCIVLAKNKDSKEKEDKKERN
jgi:hypothetical protein